MKLLQNIILTIAAVILTGCATSKEVTIEYETDRFGVPYPVVDGVAYELTEDERDAIGQSFVNAYCAP